MTKSSKDKSLWREAASQLKTRFTEVPPQRKQKWLERAAIACVLWQLFYSNSINARSALHQQVQALWMIKGLLWGMFFLMFASRYERLDKDLATASDTNHQASSERSMSADDVSEENNQ